MRLTHFARSGRIWGRMPWEARLQFLQAVFFTGSGVGFLLDLANPRPGRTAHIVFLAFMGGAIGAVYGFCFLQAPKLLPILMAVHVVLALVLTPHLGSLAMDWAQVASNAAGVDVIGCLFAILLGYVCSFDSSEGKVCAIFESRPKLSLPNRYTAAWCLGSLGTAHSTNSMACQFPVGRWAAT